jgi:hypothetical protein
VQGVKRLNQKEKAIAFSFWALHNPTAFLFSLALVELSYI